MLQIEKTPDQDIELLLSPITTISWKESELLIHFIKDFRNTKTAYFGCREALSTTFNIHRQYITILLAKLRRRGFITLEKQPRFKIESGRGIIVQTEKLQNYIIEELDRLNLSINDVLTQREKYNALAQYRHHNTRKRILKDPNTHPNTNTNIDPNTDPNTSRDANTNQILVLEQKNVLGSTQNIVNKGVDEHPNTSSLPNTDPNTNMSVPDLIREAENAIEDLKPLLNELKKLYLQNPDQDTNTKQNGTNRNKNAVYNIYNILSLLYPYISKDIYSYNKDITPGSAGRNDYDIPAKLISQDKDQRVVIKTNQEQQSAPVQKQVVPAPKKTMAQRLLEMRPSRPAKSQPSKINVDQNIKLNKIVLHWNNLKGVRKHTRPTSNVYKTILRRLNAYLNGEQGRWKWDSSWLDQLGINRALLKNKMTEADILKTIDEMMLLFEEGYWPPKKTSLPRDLATLLYDPRTQKSWFLSVLSNGVQPLKSKVAAAELEKLDGWPRRAYTELLKEINYIRNKPEDTLLENEQESLVRLVKDLEKVHTGYLETHPMDVPPKYIDYCMDYKQYLYNHLNYGMDIHIRMLRVGGYWWKQFMKAVYVVNV